MYNAYISSNGRDFTSDIV